MVDRGHRLGAFAPLLGGIARRKAEIPAFAAKHPHFQHSDPTKEILIRNQDPLIVDVHEPVPGLCVKACDICGVQGFGHQ